MYLITYLTTVISRGMQHTVAHVGYININVRLNPSIESNIDKAAPI